MAVGGFVSNGGRTVGMSRGGIVNRNLEKIAGYDDEGKEGHDVEVLVWCEIKRMICHAV